MNLLTDIQAAIAQVWPVGAVRTLTNHEAFDAIVQLQIPPGVAYNDPDVKGFVGTVVITDLLDIPAAAFDAVAVVVVHYSSRDESFDSTWDGLRTAYSRIRIVRGEQLRT